MAVQSVQANPGGGNATWLGVGGLTGLRVLVAVWDRSGGETATVSTNDPGWVTADFVQIGERVTLPTDGTHRRSVWLFESEIPTGIDSNPILTAEVLDGALSAVANTWIAIAIDENDAAGYVLVSPTGSADSGTSTTTSQGTGSTGSAPAGDILLIAVETSKGSTTATWTTTDNTPDTWDLTVTVGSGPSQRRGSVGYAVLLGQAAQAWSDTVTYGTARTSSAVIAAFVKSAGGTAVTINDRPTGTRASGPAETVTANPSGQVVINDRPTSARAGGPSGVDVVVTMQLLDRPTGTRASGPPEAVVVGVTIHDRLSSTRASGPAAALAVGVTITDRPRSARAGGPAETLTANPPPPDVIVNLHFIPLAPELGHGPGLAPEVITRTALAPELAHAAAGAPEMVDRSAGPPELGHGAASPPETAHGQPEVELGHGNPSPPEV